MKAARRAAFPASAAPVGAAYRAAARTRPDASAIGSTPRAATKPASRVAHQRRRPGRTADTRRTIDKKVNEPTRGVRRSAPQSA